MEIPPMSGAAWKPRARSEEHTSELQSQSNIVCRLLPEEKERRADQQRIAQIVHSKRPVKWPNRDYRKFILPLPRDPGPLRLVSNIQGRHDIVTDRLDRL